MLEPEHLIFIWKMTQHINQLSKYQSINQLIVAALHEMQNTDFS